MNQKARILKYMEENGGITAREAADLGVMRLAARIMELRSSGLDIVCEMMKGRNEYGPYQYARYRRA